MNVAVGQRLSDREAMLLAIIEAQKGWGHVHHNPMVGCVILDSEGKFLSSGYHARWGGNHAEINALDKLTSEQLAGAQFFVTLEPCAHEGKTPSCAQTMAKYPLKRVVYGLEDPNPQVSGQGAQILKDAGIAVELFNDLKPQLEKTCESFLYNMRTKKTYVALKVATSLDGQMALKNGQSQWITGERAREYSHYLRAQFDAVAVGIQTVLIDNPSLNVRHKEFPDHKNKIVIFDPNGMIFQQKLEDLNILKVRARKDIIVVVNQMQRHLKNWDGEFDILFCPMKNMQHFDLNFILDELYIRGVKSLFVEGGAQTLSAFLENKKAQRVYLFQAPVLLGEGLQWTQSLRLENMHEKISLLNLTIQKLEPDLLVTGQPDWSAHQEKTNMNQRFQPTWVRATDGKIAGVCQGLGRGFGIEPWVLRLVWVIAVLWFGSGLFLYFLMLITLPKEDQLSQAMSGRLLGVCARISKKYGYEIGLVRFVAVLGLIFSFGAVAFLYVITHFILPNEKQTLNRS